ncbi:MAG: beta-ketoacyl-ACP synthase II [Alphaproteobacteria bacterium]|nr:beta-ketoacyl-ACP synthase II [Alphaproteobacteria bacterium]
MNRRVVVTGQGIVSPLGTGVDYVFARLLAGESGIDVARTCDLSGIPVDIAGEVPEADSEDTAKVGDMVLERVIGRRERKKMHRFIQLAMVAGQEAMVCSGLQAGENFDPDRAGCLVGSGIGGLSGIAETALLIEKKGPKRVSPFFIAANLINLASGFLSIRHQLRGPNQAVVTACATGCHAIGDSFQFIKENKADVMICGGTEAAVSRIGIAGFAASRALSTGFNDCPQAASRPWDEARDGFVMGEGAGILVLEEYEHAKARGALIYAEVVGYGLSGDAFHMTLPAEDGNGAYRTMQMALETAAAYDVTAQDIDYINAHGTSTPAGDVIEICAIRDTYGAHADSLAVSSTKSAIGHLLGAAGAVEAIFSIEALRQGVVPPTLNLDNPSPKCDVNLVPHQSQNGQYSTAMSNSFGFGGTNASLIFRLV